MNNTGCGLSYTWLRHVPANPRLPIRRFASHGLAHPARGKPLDPGQCGASLLTVQDTPPPRPALPTCPFWCLPCVPTEGKGALRNWLRQLCAAGETPAPRWAPSGRRVKARAATAQRLGLDATGTTQRFELGCRSEGPTGPQPLHPCHVANGSPRQQGEGRGGVGIAARAPRRPLGRARSGFQGQGRGKVAGRCWRR